MPNNSPEEKVHGGRLIIPSDVAEPWAGFCRTDSSLLTNPSVASTTPSQR